MSASVEFDKSEDLKKIKKEILLCLEKKRVKESQLCPLLEKLFFFDLDINEWVFLIELTSHESKKIRRYAQYFLECCHDQKEVLKDETVKLITDEALSGITNSNATKAAHSIRMLASVTKFDDKTAPLSKAINEVIRTSNLNTNEQKSDDTKSLKKRRSSKLLLTPLNLPSEALCATRAKFGKPDINIMNAVMKGINSKDRVTARHCAALIYEFSKIEPELTCSALKVNVGGNNALISATPDDIDVATAGIYRNDETVRHYWVKICGIIGHTKSLSGYLPFKVELYDFLYDLSDRVAFGAIEEILRGDWNDILKAVTSPPNDSKTEVKVLSLIIKRLITGIKSSNIPTVHTACRLSKLLAESCTLSKVDNIKSTNSSLTLARPSSSRKIEKRSKTIANRVKSKGEHPLSEIEEELFTLLSTTKSQSVVVQALHTFVWLTNHDNVSTLSKFVMSESQDLPTHLMDIVLKEFLKRARYNSFFVEVVLDIFYRIYCSIPAKLNSKLLIETWRKVIKIGEHHRQKVLFNIFCFLETPPKRETRQLTQNIQRMIFWFLGDQANILTGERCSIVCEKDAIINSQGQVELVLNSSMEAILSKIEQSIVYSSWETRIVCIEALAKIAFHSGLPVRMRIYHFLLQCANENQLCIYHVAIHVVKALEILFSLRRKWVMKYEYGKKFKSDEEKKSFLSEIEIMKQEIMPFCDMKDQNPLGPDVYEFVEVNKKLVTKMKKRKKKS